MYQVYQIQLSQLVQWFRCASIRIIWLNRCLRYPRNIPSTSCGAAVHTFGIFFRLTFLQPFINADLLCWVSWKNLAYHSCICVSSQSFCQLFFHRRSVPILLYSLLFDLYQLTNTLTLSLYVEHNVYHSA